MSTTHPCPCCQKDFTPSVSADAAEKDSMQNLFDCPHCQSVLKWEQNTIKVIHKADPEEPQKLDLPAEATQQTADDPSDAKPPLSEPSEPAPLDQTEQPLSEPSEPAPLDQTEQPLSELSEPLTESPGMKQPTNESDESTSEKNFKFDEAHPEEELEQVNTNISSTPQSEEEKEPPAAASQSNFNLSNEEDLAASANTSENFSDIESYGNSEDTIDKGFLHYDISIQGVDSKKIEQQVLSILEEPRFNWMAKEILSLQKDGVLIIKKLNPIKAMRLISELSFLPVTLSWKQYMAITELQAEATTEEQPPEGEIADNPAEDTQE